VGGKADGEDEGICTKQRRGRKIFLSANKREKLQLCLRAKHSKYQKIPTL
jgi:hypothetical protein